MIIQRLLLFVLNFHEEHSYYFRDTKGTHNITFRTSTSQCLLAFDRVKI